MKAENFIAFITVFGFFIGLIFSLLNTKDAESFLAYTLLVSVFFYLFAHFTVSFFVRFLNEKESYLVKSDFEKMADRFKNEIVRRENHITEPFDLKSTYDTNDHEYIDEAGT